MKIARLLLAWLVVFCSWQFLFAAPPNALQRFECKPTPEIEALFQQREGWIGADGAYSAPLSGAAGQQKNAVQKTVWLFSDTFVGKIENGKRTDATMVNNTVAVQTGIGTDAKVKYFIRRDANSKPQALITPDNGKGWFWLQAGCRVGEKLYLFLDQVEKTSDASVFGFRQIGQWLAVVANPDDEPTAWRIAQLKLPNTLFSPERLLCFGAATLSVGSGLYVYGIDEDRTAGGLRRHLIVVKVPAAKIEDFSAWQYFQDGGWTGDFRNSLPLCDGLASEFSVSYLPKLRQYVLIYTENGMSPNILARTAAKPEGPWSEPVTVYHCPDFADDKRVFCYAAKGHPELSSDGELLITYATNSTDFWHVAADARLYWPRFVRLKLLDR